MYSNELSNSIRDRRKKMITMDIEDNQFCWLKLSEKFHLGKNDPVHGGSFAVFQLSDQLHR